ARSAEALGRDEGIARPRYRKDARGEQARRCWTRRTEPGRAERFFGGSRICRAWDWNENARRAEPAELRRTGVRHAIAGRNGNRRRADGERGASGRPDAR